MRYIGYYRVSTRKQESNGMSLQWQKESVRDYISKQADGILFAEFSEAETGTRKRKRVEIYKAINLCKEDIENTTIIIARMDRLTRDVEFTYSLLNSKVKFQALDNLNANKTTIGIMAVLAQDEAERIQARNVMAIKTKRSKGIVLGNVSNLITGRAKGTLNSISKRKELAAEDNKQVTGHICDYRNAGWTYYKIAKRLNELGHKTVRGNKFSPQQAQALYLRYRAPLQTRSA